jgi:hypothetical protein
VAEIKRLSRGWRIAIVLGVAAVYLALFGLLLAFAYVPQIMLMAAKCGPDACNVPANPMGDWTLGIGIFGLAIGAVAATRWIMR